MIELFKNQSLNKILDNSKIVEDRWIDFKQTIKIMEELVRDIDKQLSVKQFEYLNQHIKINQTIINALISKKKTWKSYKSSKGTVEEHRK